MTAFRCLAGKQLPCSAIVRSQHALSASFYVHEPWSGHLAIAPVLFVNSNPSIDPAESYLTVSWEDERRADIFRVLLRSARDSVGGPPDATAPRYHAADSPRQWDAVWFAARARASELLERPAVAGADFALTEAVHCKTAAEVGVAKAYDTCVAT